jgi:hypothetical protein
MVPKLTHFPNGEGCGDPNCTGKGMGLIHNIEYHTPKNVIEYGGPMTDNEMRIAFMELGMPDMGFEGMGYAKPTEMERKIYEDTK